MNLNKSLILGIVSAFAFTATHTASAGDAAIFRTTGYFVGLTQGSNSLTKSASETPAYSNVSFAGHNLVNLAMGRSANDTSFPKQVLAINFACDLSWADLVVQDLSTSNTLTVIATSVSVDTIYQQDSTKDAGPNRAQFVASLQINPNGNETNGLAGGFLTVSGRINLNPETGCPQPVALRLDGDSLDIVVDDVELPAGLDADSAALNQRTGLAHAVGVVDTITNGNSRTVLVPYAGLSIRRELPVQQSIAD